MSDSLHPRISGYDIVRPLGVGAMAGVYLARKYADKIFARDVALKVIHSHLRKNAEFERLFMNEARLGGCLHHPHIVPTLDFGNQEGRLFLVMEYVDGATLEDVMAAQRQRGESIRPDVSLEIVKQVCSALDYAHNARGMDEKPLHLVHRDLKPSNIMLSRHGLAMVADFGIARAESEIVERESEGELIGTTLYFSPEQAIGSAQLDHRADLFSLGLILYELLTLSPLYDGENHHRVLIQAQRGLCLDRLDLLPRMHAREEVIAFLRRTLSFDPNDRFPSAGAMEEVLDDILGQFPERIQLKTWVRRLSQQNRLRPTPQAPDGDIPSWTSGSTGGAEDIDDRDLEFASLHPVSPPQSAPSSPRGPASPSSPAHVAGPSDGLRAMEAPHKSNHASIGHDQDVALPLATTERPPNELVEPPDLLLPPSHFPHFDPTSSADSTVLRPVPTASASGASRASLFSLSSHPRIAASPSSPGIRPPNHLLVAFSDADDGEAPHPNVGDRPSSLPAGSAGATRESRDRSFDLTLETPSPTSGPWPSAILSPTIGSADREGPPVSREPDSTVAGVLVQSLWKASPESAGPLEPALDQPATCAAPPSSTLPQDTTQPVSLLNPIQVSAESLWHPSPDASEPASVLEAFPTNVGGGFESPSAPGIPSPTPPPSEVEETSPSADADPRANHYNSLPETVVAPLVRMSSQRPSPSTPADVQPVGLTGPPPQSEPVPPGGKRAAPPAGNDCLTAADPTGPSSEPLMPLPISLWGSRAHSVPSQTTMATDDSRDRQGRLDPPRAASSLPRVRVAPPLQDREGARDARDDRTAIRSGMPDESGAPNATQPVAQSLWGATPMSVATGPSPQEAIASSSQPEVQSLWNTPLAAVLPAPELEGRPSKAHDGDRHPSSFDKSIQSMAEEPSRHTRPLSRPRLSVAPSLEPELAQMADDPGATVVRPHRGAEARSERIEGGGRPAAPLPSAGAFASESSVTGILTEPTERPALTSESLKSTIVLPAPQRPPPSWRPTPVPSAPPTPSPRVSLPPSVGSFSDPLPTVVMPIIRPAIQTHGPQGQAQVEIATESSASRGINPMLWVLLVGILVAVGVIVFLLR